METETKTPHEEDSIFDPKLTQLELEDYNSRTRSARNWLFAIGIIFFLGDLLSLYISGVPITASLLVIPAVLAMIFFGLGVWALKQPYKATLTGLIIYLALIVLSAVLSGAVNGAAGVLQALFSGIILKIIILLALFRLLYTTRGISRPV